MKKWNLNSWNNYPAKHLPDYPDKSELDMVLEKIKKIVVGAIKEITNGIICCKLVDKKFAKFYMKKEINNIWNGNKNITIIPGGVETKKYYPINNKKNIKSKYGLNQDKYYVLTIRRLENRMGIENLVRAISLIEDDNICLLIGGKGTLKNALMCLIVQLGIGEKVKLFSQSLQNFDGWQSGTVDQFKIRAAYGETGSSAGFGSIFTSLNW